MDAPNTGGFNPDRYRQSLSVVVTATNGMMSSFTFTVAMFPL
jgi:hypothetical protein